MDIDFGDPTGLPPESGSSVTPELDYLLELSAVEERSVHTDPLEGKITIATLPKVGASKAHLVTSFAVSGTWYPVFP